ncbi:MAG: hypothetical protein JWP35_1806 [Caulobacter sp.]|nr:hypothetical protein [Caulobacter sp.]
MAKATRCCAACGYPSTNPEAFRHERVGAGRTQPVCLACAPPPPSLEKGMGRSLAMTLVLLAFGSAAWASDHPDGWNMLAALVLGLALGRPLTVLTHELGHAAVGRLVGARIDRIVLGATPVILSFRTGLTTWTIGLDVLFGGGGAVYRYFLDRTTPARWRVMAVTLGGGLANIIAGALVLAAAQEPAGRPPTHPLLDIVLTGMALSQLGTAAINLWPFSRKPNTEKTSLHDGVSLVRTLRHGVDAKAERLAAIALHTQALTRSGQVGEAAAYNHAAWLVDPDNGDLCAAWLHYLALASGHAAVVEAAEALKLTDPGDPRYGDGSFAYVAANIAWSALSIGTRETVAMAKALSAAGYAARPSAAAVAGTQGALMVEQGEAPKGAALLRESVRFIEDLKEKGGLLRWLERAEAAMGDIPMAVEYGRMAEWMERDRAPVRAG